jgi:hypothetical protein
VPSEPTNPESIVSRIWREFHAELKARGLKYSAVPNHVLESRYLDDTGAVDFDSRCDALADRTSYGNWNLHFCCDRGNWKTTTATALSQSDFCELLAAAKTEEEKKAGKEKYKRRVSDWVKRRQSEGRLLVDSTPFGRIMPAFRPQAPAGSPEREVVSVYQSFRESWETQHQADLQRLAEARAKKKEVSQPFDKIIKEVESLFLNDWKAFQRQQEAAAESSTPATPEVPDAPDDEVPDAADNESSTPQTPVLDAPDKLSPTPRTDPAPENASYPPATEPVTESGNTVALKSRTVEQNLIGVRPSVQGAQEGRTDGPGIGISPSDLVTAIVAIRGAPVLAIDHAARILSVLAPATRSRVQAYVNYVAVKAQGYQTQHKEYSVDWLVRHARDVVAQLAAAPLAGLDEVVNVEGLRQGITRREAIAYLEQYTNDPDYSEWAKAKLAELKL